eukprot:TRINITY_DN29_c0_g1_i3.p1 TRINITY_DN29_c0_g1~~TRINITY_DN29_c0_g1_i3.p1  ORF type:complete len:325 (+),score=-71.23 TRINITY_DN29_c0_g1_i3:1382-2356(+)
MKNFKKFDDKTNKHIKTKTWKTFFFERWLKKKFRFWHFIKQRKYLYLHYPLILIGREQLRQNTYFKMTEYWLLNPQLPIYFIFPLYTFYPTTTQIPGLRRNFYGLKRTRRKRKLCKRMQIYPYSTVKRNQKFFFGFGSNAFSHPLHNSYKYMGYPQKMAPRLYFTALKEQQMWRSKFYNLKYYQIKNLFQNLPKNLNSAKGFLHFMEYRLDVASYRCNLYSSIFEARQKIKNNLITINLQIINNPNWLIDIGDVISTLEWNLWHFRLNRYALHITHTDQLPNWVQVNSKIPAGIYFDRPKIKSLSYRFPLWGEFFAFNFINKYR